MMRETVFLETPDSRAMSLIVTVLESAFLLKGILWNPSARAFDRRVSVQRAVTEMVECHSPGSGRVDRRFQGQEATGHIVMVTRDVHLHGILLPMLAIPRSVYGQDVAVVGDPQPQFSTLAAGRERLGAVQAIAVQD